MDIFGAAVGGMANIGLGTLNNRWSKENTREFMKLNYDYNEKAAQNADTRTRALYKDIYSPQALIQQYQKAGLSPSMMFGGTPGQGGTAGAQGAGTSGPQPAFMPLSLLEGVQAANIAAQTEKTKAETKSIEAKREPEISVILAEAGYKKAAKAVTAAQTEGIKLDNYVKSMTTDANIYTICELAEKTSYEASKMYEELKQAKITTKINTEIYDTEIKKAKEELNAITQSIVESKSRVQLNGQQKQYLRNEVLKSFDEIAQSWKELEIKENNQTTYEEWIEAQIPMLEKNLEVKLKELGIQKTKIWIDAILDSIKAVATTAVAITAFKGGQGSKQTPPIQKTPNPKNEIWY